MSILSKKLHILHIFVKLGLYDTIKL